LQAPTQYDRAIAGPEGKRLVTQRWAVSTVVMWVLSIVIGFGAAAVVGRQQITLGDPQGKISVLLVSQAIMGAEYPRSRRCCSPSWPRRSS
jgi:hypothetical protein